MEQLLFGRVSLRQLLPSGVVVAELTSISREFPMYPEEKHSVAVAAPKRVREFSAGRHCARLALEKLGITQFPLLPGVDRSPCWPSTIVGSITHARDYCGVAVGKREDFTGIGIDVEVVSRVDRTLACNYVNHRERIFTHEETKRLDSLPPEKRLNMMAVIFSAKEAFYKCQYCITQKLLDFNAVTIRPDNDGCFLVEPHAQDSLLLNAVRHRGKFVFCRGLILTAFVITAPQVS